MLDIDFIKNTSVCPIAVQGDTLVVATSEPANLFAIEEVKRRTQMNLQVVACSAEAIEAVCNSFDEAKIEYNLEIRSGNLADSRNSPTAIRGKTQNIILRVNLSKWSKLKPRKPD